MKNLKRYNVIDLFAGCGGLTDGFEQTNHFNTVACVEWDEYAIQNLKKRLHDKWNYKNVDNFVLRFDIQQTDKLFKGWSNDAKYGSSIGLDKLISSGVDVIIGGPPCQAYSMAGRIQDKNNMKLDYRNYLFESYLAVVERYKPKLIIFENVQGILSACPDGEKITSKIQKAFSKAGYHILPNLKNALFDVADFGIPQHRKRVIIFGIRSDIYKRFNTLLSEFYDVYMPKRKAKHIKTVFDAIGDLPKLLPVTGISKKAYTEDNTFLNHKARYQSDRDKNIFKLLTKDIESGANKYTDVKSLKKLYTKITGKESNIHKYNVLKWNEPSNTIPAHLCKDGLRHIHPDSEQLRTITVREAARLQSFDDDFEFIGPQTEQFKMIGNAVPPKFAHILADVVYEILLKIDSE